jgi:uncharacterized protein (TIRG00374 family)
LGLLYWRRGSPETLIWIGLGLLGIALLIGLVHQRGLLAPLLDRLPLAALRQVTGNSQPISLVGFYSFFIFVLMLIQGFLVLESVGVSAPVWFVTVTLPLAVVVGMLPLTVAGMGTRDAAFVFLFQSYGPPEALLAVGLLYSVIRYWIPSLVGTVFLLIETSGLTGSDEG